MTPCSKKWPNIAPTELAVGAAPPQKSKYGTDRVRDEPSRPLRLVPVYSRVRAAVRNVLAGLVPLISRKRKAAFPRTCRIRRFLSDEVTGFSRERSLSG